MTIQEKDSTVEIPAKVAWLLVLVFLLILLAIFSLGRFWESTIPCDHNKPYEVRTIGGGVMLITPEGWYAVPVLNKHGRPYMRPTDEEG